MNMEQIAHSTLAIVRATDLDDLPTDGSETLDLAVRHTILWQDHEIERLQAELSWIYANCELRDRDNTHIDSDDVQSAIAAEAKGG